MDKVQNLLNCAITNVGSNFNPGDEITWNSWELERGRQISLQNKIEEALEDIRNPESNQGVKGLDILSKNDYLKIFFEFRLIAKYFAGEFRLYSYIWNKNIKQEFYQIFDLFIEKWYFSYVYVGYGEDLLELDKRLFAANNSEKSANKDIYKFCRFRLYTKSGDKFYSILAGQIVESRIVNEDRLVRCSFDEGTVWLYWWHILLEHFSGVKRCLNAWKSISKQIVMENFGEEEKKSTKEQIANNDTIFFKPMSTEDIGEETFCQPMKFIDANDVSHMFGILYDYTERQAAKMGYVFRPSNLKKERTNSGENYALNKMIFNIQTVFLTKLNSCLFNMRKTFGGRVIPKELKFVLSNQAYALGLPNPTGSNGIEQGYLRNGTPNPENKNNKQDAD